MSVCGLACRSVVVGPKKAGGAPSPAGVSTVAANPAASAAGGTPINNVAVVSSSDTTQNASADTAAGEPITWLLRRFSSHWFPKTALDCYSVMIFRATTLSPQTVGINSNA